MSVRLCQIIARTGLVGFVAALGGCSAQQQFYAVQVCPVPPADFSKLAEVMRRNAERESLSFVNNSTDLQTSLSNIDAETDLPADRSLLIDLHIEGANGLGVTAGNLGLYASQVSLGFTEGGDPIKARRLKDSLIRDLGAIWTVTRVDHTRGIQPDPACKL